MYQIAFTFFTGMTPPYPHVVHLLLAWLPILYACINASVVMCRYNDQNFSEIGDYIRVAEQETALPIKCFAAFL